MSLRLWQNQPVDFSRLIQFIIRITDSVSGCQNVRFIAITFGYIVLELSSVYLSTVTDNT